jgi:hypothetical protein
MNYTPGKLFYNAFLEKLRSMTVTRVTAGLLKLIPDAMLCTPVTFPHSPGTLKRQLRVGEYDASTRFVLTEPMGRIIGFHSAS